MRSIDLVAGQHVVRNKIWSNASNILWRVIGSQIRVPGKRPPPGEVLTTRLRGLLRRGTQGRVAQQFHGLPGLFQERVTIRR